MVASHGLVFGSTDLCIIFRSPAGTWFHPSIPPWLTHTLTHPPEHPRIPLSTHFILCLSRAHTSVYPPVHQSVCTHMHPASCPAIYPATYPFVYLSINHIFFQPPSHTTSHPSILNLFTFLCKFTSIYILFSPLSIHTHISVHTCTHTSSIHPFIHHLHIHSSFYPSSHPPTHRSLLSCSHLYSYLHEC